MRILFLRRWCRLLPSSEPETELGNQAGWPTESSESALRSRLRFVSLQRRWQSQDRSIHTFRKRCKSIPYLASPVGNGIHDCSQLQKLLRLVQGSIPNNICTPCTARELRILDLPVSVQRAFRLARERFAARPVFAGFSRSSVPF